MESNKTETLNNNGEGIRDAVTGIKTKLSEAGKQAVDAAQKVACELGGVGKEKIKAYTEEGKKQLTNMEDYVKANPVKSVLMSVAAGFVITKLLKR